MRIRSMSPANVEYAKWLSQLSYAPSMRTSVTIPQSVRICTEKDDFISRIYPSNGLLNSVNGLKFFRSKAILTITNETVREIDAILLDRIP